MSTVEEVGTKIRHSIRESRNHGWAIKPGTIRNRDNRSCCALGAVVYDLPDEAYCMDGLYNSAQNRLGLGNYEACEIASGFDGEKRTTPANLWVQLGRQIRMEVESGEL